MKLVIVQQPNNDKQCRRCRHARVHPGKVSSSRGRSFVVIIISLNLPARQLNPRPSACPAEGEKKIETRSKSENRKYDSFMRAGSKTRKGY